MRPPVHRRGLVYLAAAGPGLIAAAAGNDAGGVVTYSSAGSEFIYRTLFLMVLITIAYVVVQEMVARLAVHTGKGLAALIREEFPLRMTAFAVTAFAIANIGLMVTEFGGIATAFDLFGVSRYLSVPIAAVAIWSLVLFGSYRYAERVFLLLTVVFIAYPIAAILGHPNWHEVAANTLWPHFIASKSFLLLSVALIGTTITPYIQLYEAGAVVDKGVKPEEYKFQRVDAIVGAILAAFVAMSIIVATGATIGGSGPLTSATHAAHALRPVAGPAAEVLFGLGLLGASALAAAVVPLSTSYAVAEAVGVERSVSSSFRQAPLFLGLFTGADPGRGGGGPGAGQPDHPDFEHPGPRGRDHPHDPGPDPGPGQPALAARAGSQRALGPLARRPLHPLGRRCGLGLRGADRSGVVRPLMTVPEARMDPPFAQEPGVRGGYAAMAGRLGTPCA